MTPGNEGFGVSWPFPLAEVGRWAKDCSKGLGSAARNLSEETRYCEGVSRLLEVPSCVESFWPDIRNQPSDGEYPQF